MVVNHLHQQLWSGKQRYSSTAVGFPNATAFMCVGRWVQAGRFIASLRNKSALACSLLPPAVQRVCVVSMLCFDIFFATFAS